MTPVVGTTESITCFKYLKNKSEYIIYISAETTLDEMKEKYWGIVVCRPFFSGRGLQ